MTNETIAQVVKEGLCTGCGTCIALCPKEAIELRMDKSGGIYVPKLNEEKCNNCGICYNVCPGHEVDFNQLNLEIFGKEPEDVLIGNYLNCYIGHSTDYDIRYNSASGGLVTALLIFALEEGMIDGALVTKMSKNNPFEPEVFIARSKEEIISASKSKYCPVPANIAVKEILESKEGEKFAVVGLTCHIHGIRKAELFNEKLKEKIILHIGIFCSNTPNFLATEFVLQKMKVRKEDVKKIDYRGDGWPGAMKISLESGELLLLSNYWDSGFGLYFSSIRCKLCTDHTCELADISFGDAWLPELVDKDRIGTSIIVSRTRIGEEILQRAISKGKIELNEIDSKKVIQAQGGNMVVFRKSDLKARILLLKTFGKNVPTYNQEWLEPKPSAYLHAMLFFISFYLLGILSKKRFWYLLPIYVSSRRYFWNRLMWILSYVKKHVSKILALR